MTESYYGQLRPNWISTTGVETVTSNMDFITITTGIDIRPSATGGAVVVTNTNGTFSATATITVVSTVGLTIGMVVSGTGIVGTPIVTSLTSSTVVVLSTPQTLGVTATPLTFSSNSQLALNKLLEIVSERGQPIIMGNVTNLATSTLTNGPFQLFLAIEHWGWSVMQYSGFAGPITAVTSALSSASTTLNVVTTGLGIVAGAQGVGMQVYGPGIAPLAGVIPSIASITGTTAVCQTSQVQTVAAGVTLTFSPVPVATGARLADRILQDGINYGWGFDNTAGTLGVQFSSILT